MPKKVTEAKIQLHLQTLRETPQRIADCTDGMDETRLKISPAPDGWSVVEIVAHLRGCADVWSNSIYAMLNFDKPELVYIHPRDWAKEQDYASLTFVENFHAFQAGRHKLLQILEGLSLEEWERSARFTGKANTFTVFGETMRMALHEIDHWNQIETTVSSV